MERGKLVDINLARTGVFSGGDWILPLSNLATDERYIEAPARCADCTDLAKSQFVMTFAVPRQINLVGLLFHTMGLAAKVKVTIAGLDLDLDNPVKVIDWTPVFSVFYPFGTINPEILIASNAAAMVGATGLNHNRYLHVPKHNDGAGGNGGWDSHVIQSTIRALKAQSPQGAVDDASLIFNTIPVTDAADIAAQLIDRVPPSLQGNGGTDTAHLSGPGNVILAEYSYSRWLEAMGGGLPFIPHQRVYSNVTTNQVVGGLVCTLDHYSSISGTLTGAVVDVPISDHHFSAAIEAGAIVVRRRSPVTLLAGKYDVKIRVTKGGKSRITTVRIFIGSSAPSGAYRAAINGDIMVKNGSLAGAANGKILNLAFGFKPLAGSDGTGRRILRTGVGAATGGIFVEVKTTNRVGIIVRDAANAAVANFDSSGVAGQLTTEANGMKWIFFSVDTSTGYGRIAVDANAATTGTVVTDGVMVPGPQGVAGSLSSYLFGDAGNIALNKMEFAGLWASTDPGVDFGPTTGHRDLVRDPVTLQCKLGQAGGLVNGAAPFLWVQGAGNIAAGINLGRPAEIWDTLNKSGITNVGA